MRIRLFWIFLLAFLLLAGCSAGEAESAPAATATPTPAAAVITTPTPTESIPDREATEPVPLTETPAATPSDPHNATDNPAVNETINALLDQDLEALLAAVQFNSQPCTTADGLGGPPKCPEGIPDKTVLSFLPVLGPGEGSQLFAEDVPGVFDYQTPQLFRVILVKPRESLDLVYPPGTYAVVLSTGPEGFARTFRLSQDGKIVRADYSAWTPEEEVERIEGVILFAP